MKRSVFLHIEDIVKCYPRMNEFINKCANNPYYQLDDEKRISILKEQQSVIKNVISNSSSEILEVVDGLYFHHDPNKNLDGVAYDLHISTSTLFYRRNKFLESVRRGLGW